MATSWERRHLVDPLWLHKRVTAGVLQESPPDGLLLESDTATTDFLLLENAADPHDALLLESSP